MTDRLEDLTREIAAELVQGPEVTAIVMDECEQAGVNSERWADDQRLRINWTEYGFHRAITLLACSGSGTIDEGELTRLTHRLAVAWAKVERHRSAALDDELRDVAAGGDKA